MTTHTDSHLSIACGDLEAKISVLGAELVSLRYRGQELLWQGDPNYWARQSPVLFPVVGKVRDGQINVSGKTYPMPQHGFASISKFESSSRTASNCSLRLTSSASTHQYYPFDFALTLNYELSAQGLHISAEVLNPGGGALPASFGFHPGFAWPLEPGRSKEEYEVYFPQDTQLKTTRLDSQGALRMERSPLALDGGALALEESLFTPSALIVFDRASEWLEYRPRSGGGLGLKVHTKGLPELGLWMRPGAPYLCIEPWHGTADPEIAYGDFSNKPGLAHIEPGQTRVFAIRCEITHHHHTTKETP
ncbi:MAG TPA: aldose 1-epimerase family protein [Polaromonas sp.]|uniref:aldose 1-epimerase family protein n=1 Tax=Polaromonas sp. TaxID=1869339 RepID=UPI002D2A4320|nr:aldose 1-epimerase family protein [Polaromonas sp.]HYW58131.1 aldose 1-epimerase family protein [Polaromonas sp.]